jgi:hypothetical protein
MWTHAILLTLALVIIRAIGDTGGSPGVRTADSPRRAHRTRTWVRVSAFSVAAVWIASLWAPFYVKPATADDTAPDRIVVAEFTHPATTVGPLLLDGTTRTGNPTDHVVAQGYVYRLRIRSVGNGSTDFALYGLEIEADNREL